MLLSLKATSSQGEEDTQRRTELCWSAPELAEQKANTTVAEESPGRPGEIGRLHDYHLRMHVCHRGSSMKNACRWDRWKCQ